VYFSEVPYDEYHKLEKDPVYGIQHGGKPPRFTLRGLKLNCKPYTAYKIV
jgi:hypothetical protein